MSQRPTVRAALRLLAMLLTGCATIAYTEPRVSDVPIRRWRQEVPTEGAHAEVQQAGTTVTIAASQTCDVRDEQMVKRTSMSEATNESASYDWLLLGLGVASGGSGALLMVDAPNTYEDDKTSRTYNPTGAGNERAWGIALIAAGAALIAVPIIDGIRASETRVETQEVTIHGEPQEHGIACKNRPLASATISGQAGSRSFDLGVTDAQGKLTVDLDTAIDGDFVVRSGATNMTALAGGHAVGAVDLGPLRDVREARFWEQIDVQRCREPKAFDACKMIERFMSAYPDGVHSVEAGELLDDAKPKVRALEDERLWQSINVEACTRQTYETSDEIRAACEPLEGYLEAFPTGVHAKAAQASLSRGRERADAMDRSAEAARLAEQEREAAQQKAEADEEAARRKATAEKDAAQARRRCVGACKQMCSAAEYQADPDGCFARCLESKCQ